ncbi:MAG: DUF1349 domain-containing protein [Actinomycetes bacterium]
MQTTIAWRDGEWTRPPHRVVEGPDGTLQVAAEAGSDAWRDTYYGFRRESAHALLVSARKSSAYEVSFRLDYTRQYDQAGLMLVRDAQQWVKAGVEITDGSPHAGAVVTTPAGSDWSVAPAAAWAGTVVTLRASLDRGAVLLRARSEDGPWQFLRLAPLPPGALRVGPYLCAPEGEGLEVAFTAFRAGPADPDLHLDESSPL